MQKRILSMSAQQRTWFSGNRAYIYGIVNEDPLTPDIILKVGQVAGTVLRSDDNRHGVVIGKDTRVSGYMIEEILAGGFMSVGMHVFLTGPVPAPGIAMLAESMRCHFGVMVGASEGLFNHSGIELFGPHQQPLSPQVIARMEELLRTELPRRSLAAGIQLGRAKRIDDAQGRYIEFVKRTLPNNSSFDGIRVVLDCANGATYKVAPQAFEELGAEVFAVGIAPNGTNINAECGLNHPQTVIHKVRYHRAEIGFVFDGSGSRLAVIDEKGGIVPAAQVSAVAGEASVDALALALNIVEQVRQSSLKTSVFFEKQA